MAHTSDRLASSRRLLGPVLVVTGLAVSGCASLEPLPSSAASAPESVAFDDGGSVDGAAAEAPTEPVAQPTGDAGGSATPAADGVDPSPADQVDTSAVSLAALLPTSGVLGPNWVGNAEIAYSIPEVLSGEGDCAVGFRSDAIDVVDGSEAFSESTGTIVVNSVAARLASSDAAQALLDRIAVRDAVTCDGDPNAIVYIENRDTADVAFSWSIDVAGEQGPLETGVVLVRRGDVIMVGSVVAEAGVHDIESVLWRIVDHAIVGLGS